MSLYRGGVSVVPPETPGSHVDCHPGPEEGAGVVGGVLPLDLLRSLANASPQVEVHPEEVEDLVLASYIHRVAAYHHMEVQVMAVGEESEGLVHQVDLRTTIPLFLGLATRAGRLSWNLSTPNCTPP